MTNVTPRKPESIEIVELPARYLAYVRHVGPYAGQQGLFERLWGQIFQWAGPRGLVTPEAERLCIYHDNPDITDEEKLRISLGITVAKATPPASPVSLLEIPAGKHAVATYVIDPADYGAAWLWVMGDWVPGSGYQLDDRPCYEKYLNDPCQDSQGKHHVQICVAIKPL